MSNSREPIYTKGAFLNMLDAVSADKQMLLVEDCRDEINSFIAKGVSSFDMLHSIVETLHSQNDRLKMLSLNLESIHAIDDVESMGKLLDKKHQAEYTKLQNAVWDSHSEPQAGDPKRPLDCGRASWDQAALPKLTFEELSKKLEKMKNKRDRYEFLCEHLDVVQDLTEMYAMQDLLDKSHAGEYAWKQHQAWRKESECDFELGTEEVDLCVAYPELAATDQVDIVVEKAEQPAVESEVKAETAPEPVKVSEPAAETPAQETAAEEEEEEKEELETAPAAATPELPSSPVPPRLLTRTNSTLFASIPASQPVEDCDLVAAPVPESARPAP